METEKELEVLDSVEQELKGTSTEQQEQKENNSQTKNLVVTPAQQDIMKELAKIDIELEGLEKVTIDEDAFYDQLDDSLTDEEKYLQEEKPKEYLKLIDKKKKEFLKNNLNEDKKNILLEQKKDLELKNAIEVGITEVTAVYKNYNHEEMNKFYYNKLTKEEQQEILKDSASTTEVFKKTYEKYLHKNGKSAEIKNTPAPNTPDLSKVIKQTVKPNQIDDIDSDEEKYKRGLGVK